ncbi:MAG TPA: DUF6600 domain-containing protein [Pyrinomonadaceae bacterium]|nr:DUF6600 domain-containing protein [Pyrinomonadaceae bacterium]
MKNFKVWPHLTLVFALFAGLGMGAAALWMRHEPKAEALSVPAAARVERVDGEVGLRRALDSDPSDDAWLEVTPNTPLTVGDRLYAREDSRAGVAFTGRNFARLEPGSALDVVSLSDRRTQLALREGSAIFNIGALAEDELFEVATPYGAVDLRQPGLYEVGYNEDGSAFVSVLSGLAEVIGLAGSGQISKGEMLTLLGQTAAEIALSRISPDYAGGLLDDYYGYQYPNLYDGRYSDYDAYLEDPDYYDPYNRHTSYRYVPATVPGVSDLDYYGDWQNLSGHGYAWSPRAESGWAPYQQGYWTLDDPHGLTWVSSEPWGYAPYHYGRWVNAENRWFWVPDAADSRPAYSPALVAFVPLTEANQIGWVPLAPGDPYAPVSYDSNWQPQYTDGNRVALERVANFGAPGALSVVSAEDFERHIGRDVLKRFDPRSLEGARPVGDPLSVAMLRQAALETAIARRGFVLPPGLAKRLDERQVYTSAQPVAPRFRDNPSRAARFEVVPERQRKEKLRFRDERQAAVAQEPGASQAGREERRLTRQEQRQEQRQARAERQDWKQQRQESRQQQTPPARAESERPTRGGFAQGERVGQPRQAQREAAREQSRAAREQERATRQPQAEGQRHARQQAEQLRVHQQQQQQAARRSQQQQERMRGRQRVEQQQPRPQQSAQPPGRMHKQRDAAPQAARPSQGPPQRDARPQGQGQGQGRGGGKGKGRP